MVEQGILLFAPPPKRLLWLALGAPSLLRNLVGRIFIGLFVPLLVPSEWAGGSMEK
jgi:hypothetical protein